MQKDDTIGSGRLPCCHCTEVALPPKVECHETQVVDTGSRDFGAGGKLGLTQDELMGMIRHNKQVCPPPLPVCNGWPDLSHCALCMTLMRPGCSQPVIVPAGEVHC